METQYRDIWGEIIPKNQLNNYYRTFLMESNSYRKYTQFKERLSIMPYKNNSKKL